MLFLKKMGYVTPVLRYSFRLHDKGTTNFVCLCEERIQNKITRRLLRYLINMLMKVSRSQTQGIVTQNPKTGASTTQPRLALNLMKICSVKYKSRQP